MSITYINTSSATNLNLFTKACLTLFVCMSLFSCAKQQVSSAPVVVTAPVKPTLSALPLPLDSLSAADFTLAQAALDQLGYNVQFIDGIWGPRSAAALKKYEADRELLTANGRLSELNLTSLIEETGLKREAFIPEPQTPVIEPPTETGISAKLDPNSSLSNAPQLIITDLAYTVMARPSPYSEEVVKLPEGAGLYIVNLEEGWYKVETLERQQGYIKE